MHITTVNRLANLTAVIIYLPLFLGL